MREPLINLQRRLTEAGRIRAGEKTDKGAPKRLDTWRITSPHRHLIDEAAERYGGKVQPWKSPVGDEWEVVTETASLPVLIMPSYSLRQSYEHWAGPSKCERRCDGIIESLSGQPCVCNSEGFAGDECDLHTRLTVALPDLTTMLGWRLETKGENAARELAGGMEIAEALAVGRPFLPARLILTERRGQRDGQAVRYVVPVIDFGIGYSQVSGLEPGHTPVQPREQPALTVAQAVEQTNKQAQPKERSARSAAPIGQVTDFTGSAAAVPGASAADTEEGEPQADDPSLPGLGLDPPTADGENGGPSPSSIIGQKERAYLFAVLREQGITDKAEQRAFIVQHTGVASTASMTVDQLEHLVAAAKARP